MSKCFVQLLNICSGSLYSPEILVSMILQKAKEYAEAVAGESVDFVVSSL